MPLLYLQARWCLMFIVCVAFSASGFGVRVVNAGDVCVGGRVFLEVVLKFGMCYHCLLLFVTVI